MKQVSSLNGCDDLFLLRPLLGFSRDEIREYAVSRGLKWREDSTNKDTAFKRNLLRNNVFPLFARINPSFVRTLAQDMERFSQVQSLADDFVAEETPRVLKGKYRLDLGALLGNRHWKYLLFRIMESYGFAPQTIRELTSCLEAGDSAGGKRFISGDLVAVTSGSEIVIARLAASHGSLTVDGPGEYSLDGTVFSVREVTASALKQKTGTTLMAIGFPFTVRHWQDGDWMQPLGMRGRRKKLSDMFTDLKFSLPDKERALVVADEGSHVLSLLGYRIDESVKAEQGRKCILVDITG
jgi:tRNA(Ile)-lysidine synthase